MTKTGIHDAAILFTLSWLAGILASRWAIIGGLGFALLPMIVGMAVLFALRKSPRRLLTASITSAAILTVAYLGTVTP